jgi:hypothetical protein
MKNITNKIINTSLLIAFCTLLVTTTSCKKWNEYNFGDDYVNTGTTNVAEKVLTIGDKEISDIVKMLKDNAKLITVQADSLTMVRLADSIGNTKQFPTLATARTILPLYLQSAYSKLVAGTVALDAGSEIICEYRVFVDPNAANEAIAYTLTTEDYDAMGTASGTPGAFDNFDKNMTHTRYLTTFLSQKYPYALPGARVALTYNYYVGSGLGTGAFTEIFTKNEVAWNAVPRQDRFTLQADRTWKFINTLILAKTFLDGSLDPFVPYMIVGTRGWVYNNTYGAYCTEYSAGNHPGDDWLVSPSLDLTDRDVVRISFKYAANYLGVGTTLEIFGSYTYVGGEPNIADWIKVWEIPAGKPSDWTFRDVQVAIPQELLNNPNVHIAFRYTSSETAASTAEFQNLLIEALPVDVAE